jgi:hypothetical protein
MAEPKKKVFRIFNANRTISAAFCEIPRIDAVLKKGKNI